VAKRELRLARLLKRIAKFRPLIIDDIGYVQQDREEMEVLFTLLAERYERGSVMLTSNLPFSTKIHGITLSSAASLAGPCASTDRDKVDRQLQDIVMPALPRRWSS